MYIASKNVSFISDINITTLNGSPVDYNATAMRVDVNKNFTLFPEKEYNITTSKSAIISILPDEQLVYIGVIPLKATVSNFVFTAKN